MITHLYSLYCLFSPLAFAQTVTAQNVLINNRCLVYRSNIYLILFFTGACHTVGYLWSCLCLIAAVAVRMPQTSSASNSNCFTRNWIRPGKLKMSFTKLKKTICNPKILRHNTTNKYYLPVSMVASQICPEEVSGEFTVRKKKRACFIAKVVK